MEGENESKGVHNTVLHIIKETLIGTVEKDPRNKVKFLDVSTTSGIDYVGAIKMQKVYETWYDGVEIWVPKSELKGFKWEEVDIALAPWLDNTRRGMYITRLANNIVAGNLIPVIK